MMTDQLKLRFALWTCQVLQPAPHTPRSFDPKGQTPVLRRTAKRFHNSVISAINNQGKIQWMTLNEPPMR